MAEFIEPAIVPKVTLPSGEKVPCMGMGTFGSDRVSAEEVSEAVAGAIRSGYRMFDCAACYGNEHQIGEVFRAAFDEGVVERKDLFIMTKVWNDMHRKVEEACTRSIEDLQCDYVDLYFIHWPFPNYHAPFCDVDSRNPESRPFSVEEFMDTYRQCEKLVEKGKIRYIGISNMTIPKLEAVLPLMKIKPAACELELHPCFQQQEQYDYLIAHNIQPVGYMPLGSPRRPERDICPEDVADMQTPEMQEIAKAHGVHPALIALKWAHQRGEISIPFSVHNYVSNLKCVTEDPLTDEEMAKIATLEKEKKKASKDQQLSYTIEIETNKMNLKKNEYSQESKQAEIDKLQSATTNTEVRSEIDGVIQKIDNTKLSSDDGDTLDDDSTGMDYSSDSSDNSAFITILSTGAYRIKGKVNEMNRYSIVQGEPVIVRSRVDDQQIWHGTMGAIDEQSSNSSSGNGNYGMVDSSGDSDTTSSTYPFYVDLETSDGLMLGQHVYIEKDEGQEDKKEGVWLSDFYIVDADSQDPYVWAADEDGKLKKRKVVLGQYDEGLMEYEIADGLTEDDSIAFPTEALTEGLNTADAASMPAGASMYYGEDSTDSSDGTDNLDGSDDADDSQSYDGEDDADPIMDESSGDGYMDDYSDEDMQPDEELGDGDVIGGADSMDEDFDAYTQDYSDDMNSDVQYGADDTEAAG